MSNDVFVIDAVRSAVGKYGGTLSDIRPDDLASLVVKGLIARNPNVNFDETEEIILGAANQSGEDNRNVARMVALLSGLPVSVAGVTVNRLCASGLQAISDAFRGIKVGAGDLYLAGGVESMTRAPFVMAKQNTAFSRNVEVFDTTIGWRFTNPNLSKLYYPFSMGETAENVASQYNISRIDQDQFAFNSQLKYANAHENGKFSDEIIEVIIPQKKGDPVIFNKDEHPRLTDLSALSALKPVFKKDGSVTAGNASGINDGASVLAIASESFVKNGNIKPMVRIVATAAAGVDPSVMGIGPVPAVRKLLDRTGFKINDIGLFELNEAFASQSLACIQQLEINSDLVNVNGGAIAIGHPLGCSGARISTTLLHEMKKRNVKYGIATLCVGVGQGMAVLYENV